MIKKKVGIVTLYYNNDNYGGIAQAYALQKYMENMGCDVKLISFLKQKKKKTMSERLKKRIRIDKGFGTFLNGIIWICKWIIKELFVKKAHRISIKKYQVGMEQRKKRLATFRENIPHTDVYTVDEIEQCVPMFDIFVSGSDQIWKPSVVQGPFVLDFVPEGKRKVSYASSITTTNILEDTYYCEFMKVNLKDYYDISVREVTAQKELSNILDRNVKLVVDPTLLLSRDEWENITEKRIVKEPYIFTYFLGDSAIQKKYVERIAHKNGLQIVNLPFVSGEYNKYDRKFGNYKLFDIGIPEFLSLIKYADVVFTDSFHAICFSWKFGTNFYVFDRNVGFDGTGMSSRIDSILKLMNLETRKIDAFTEADLAENICFKSEDMSKKIEYSKKYIRDFLR